MEHSLYISSQILNVKKLIVESDGMEGSLSIIKIILGSFCERILASLQIRTKWNKPAKNLALIDMVAVKDDN